MFFALRCVAILCCFAFVHAGEVLQATLSNGMKYYLIPNLEKDPEICFVIKKPKDLMRMPVDIDIFNPLVRAHFSYSGLKTWPETIALSLFPFDPSGEEVSDFSELFRFDQITDAVWNELQEEYQDDKEDLNVGLFQKIVGDTQETDRVMSGDKEQLIQAYQSMIEPANMAIIVTGDFQAELLETNLESLFGKIASHGVSEVVHLTPKAVEFYMYLYVFEPSPKNYVLSDLLSLYYHERAVTVGELVTYNHIITTERICLSLDEAKFLRTKAQLESAYRTDDADDKTKAIRHFCSVLPEKVQLQHEDLILELQNVTLEDLKAFIDLYIKAHTSV